MGSYTFSGEKFQDFSRIFQDPILIYMNLPSTKQNFCVESYVVGINTFTGQKCQTRRAWKNVQTRHSLCISGSMDMRESNERAMGQNKCFHTFCKNFENFILCIPDLLFSFTLKLLTVDVFRFCSIKNQGHSQTKTNFKYFYNNNNKKIFIQDNHISYKKLLSTWVLRKIK